MTFILKFFYFLFRFGIRFLNFKNLVFLHKGANYVDGKYQIDDYDSGYYETKAEFVYVELIGSATNVRYSCFENCPNLETVTGNQNIVSIHQRAFTNCVKLKNVDFPSVKSIGYQVFQDCTSLDTVQMPMLEEIEYSAFYNCPNLQNYTFGPIKNVKSSAFYQVPITEIDLSQCQYIGDSAFYNCPITNVDLGQCQSIGDSAFFNCPLIGVNLQECTKIGQYAFSGTQIAGSVNIKGGESIEKFAFNNTKITELHVMTPRTTISSYAFQDVSTLKSVELIGCICQTYAFIGCVNIDKITIDSQYIFFESGCFDDIQACVYYLGSKDLIIDISIVVIQRIYKAVFVTDYTKSTFCRIPVQGLNSACPSKRPETPSVNKAEVEEVTCLGSKLTPHVPFLLQALTE